MTVFVLVLILTKSGIGEVEIRPAKPLVYEDALTCEKTLSDASELYIKEGYTVEYSQCYATKVEK